ncbi:acyltransferase family protein [Mucilaginibacter sp. Mucisp84]|uniref:acyltransferase family protein n=1 Tax=Mucilaginibacter sp. Mucisp84 TaxID=3243058 RepID=UPI0039A5E855
METALQIPLMTNKIREFWIDNAKVIGIALVVLGHLVLIETKITTFIYSFHMPLFFLISGYLHKNNNTFKETVKKDAQRLLVPYCYFYLITFVYWFVVVFLRHRSEYPGTLLQEGAVKPFLGLLLGVGYDTPISRSTNDPLWFLIALFNIKLIYQYLAKITKNKIEYIICITLLLVSIIMGIKYVEYDLWFSIDSAILALPFFIGGVLLKRSGIIVKVIKQKAVNIIMLVVFSVATFYLVKYNGRADINATIWGQNIILFYITGFSGTFMIIALSSLLSFIKGRLIVFISLNTLILMCVQNMLISICSFLWKVLKMTLPTHLSIGQAISVTSVVLLISLPVMYFIDRYLIFLTGAKKAR